MTEQKIVMGSTTYLVEERLAQMLIPDIVGEIEWMMGRGWSDEMVRAGIRDFLGMVHKQFPGWVRIEGRRDLSTRRRRAGPRHFVRATVNDRWVSNFDQFFVGLPITSSN